MKVILNDYITNLSSIPVITKETILPYKDIIDVSPRIDGAKYYLAWGDPVSKVKYGVMETGFFFNAMHIDTIGLYQNCSLNSPSAIRMVNNFVAPKNASDIIFNKSFPPSKYGQVNVEKEWTGVVLALQSPADRSIHRIASTEDYYGFVEGACKYYKNNLFLKLHPWNSGDIEKRFIEIAGRHGCTIGRVNHSIIKNCKFVLTYNSSFAVDCFMRGVKVAYFAPGYFWQSPAVQYTSYEYPDDVCVDIDFGYKLCDFMVYKYMFNFNMPIEKWIRMIMHFSESREIFPMKEEFCYANNI